MSPYNSDRKPPKKRDFGTRDFKSNSGFDRPALHSATCGSCGASCEVPFKPTGSRPVLCNKCFKRDDRDDDHFARNDRRPAPSSFGGDKRRSDFGDRRPAPSSGGGSRDLEAINHKLDKILRILADLTDEG
jgi:CxxC-x17-CxxC domain-containing protein